MSPTRDYLCFRHRRMDTKKKRLVRPINVSCEWNLFKCIFDLRYQGHQFLNCSLVKRAIDCSQTYVENLLGRNEWCRSYHSHASLLYLQWFFDCLNKWVSQKKDSQRLLPVQCSLFRDKLCWFFFLRNWLPQSFCYVCHEQSP